MYRKFLLYCLIAFCFNACGENTESSIVTSGTQYSKEKHKAMENIDINSYQEVADVFLETSAIQSDGKPYLLVFGANGCVYCDRLKELIRDNAEIKDFLKANYVPYYINISYTKTHQIDFLDMPLNTIELAQKYSIKPTPTLIFLSKSGKELFVYPGFLPKEKFLSTLEFFKNPNLEQSDAKSIKTRLQAHWLEQGV